MTHTLRGEQITLRRCEVEGGSFADATWLAEAAGGGVVGELETRLVVPNARRARIRITRQWQATHNRLAEALRLLVGDLFEACGCHRLELDAYDTEVDVITAARQRGFVEEGRRRDACISEGRWHNRIEFGLLEDEWRGGASPRLDLQVAPAAGVPVAEALPAIPSPTPQDHALLRGQRVTLRRTRPADREMFYRWRCRPEWWRGWMPEDPDGFRPPSRQEFDATWEETPPSHHWVVETERGIPLGVCFYSSLDTRNRSAEADVLLYEAEYWGRGYGSDAFGVLVRHLFDDLRLHRVSSGTWSGNIGSLRVQQKNGLAIETRGRESYLVEGKWYDGIGTGLLEDQCADDRWAIRMPKDHLRDIGARHDE